MNATRLIILLACIGVAGCRADEDERRSVLESAERVNYGIARGTVVRDMRAPADTGRIIYEPPTHLSRPTATSAGARQVWAPFGVATPDTVARTTTR